MRKPRTALALALAGLVTAAPAAAQPRGGVLRGKIVNGSSGGPGSAERVALIKMESGMEPIGTLGRVSGSFTLENLPIAGETPYLLQVTTDGVNYNQPVSFGRGYEAEATVTVYSATAEWKNLEISTARFLFRREHDELRVDKLFVVENKTEPKKTFFLPQGTFKFYLPSDLKELISVSASSGGGMPVPQFAEPLADGSGHVARIALKPGTTEVAISYLVDYGKGAYAFKDKAYYPLREVMALVSPADIQVAAAGLAPMGADPQNRFVVYGAKDLSAGAPIELELSGGSDHAPELVPGSGGSQAEGGDASHRVRALPDPYGAQKWIIVLLMAAALTYGLLASLLPAPATAAPPAKASKKATGQKTK
jgi:hypothetical protein